MPSRMRATYRVRLAPEEDAERRARFLAREQTVEIPEGVVSAEVEGRAIGRVVEVERETAECARVVLEFPFAAVGGVDFPQLLNVLFGNAALQGEVELVDVLWPEALLAELRGPAFGVAGLRALVGAPRRALLAAALKPLGATPRELARLAFDLARGGVDLVKEDHGLADQAFAPFRERVFLCSEQIERANRATGGRTLYAANLTGPIDRLAERVETLHEAGVRAALVAPWLVGLDALRMLSETSGLALVAHPALGGAFARPGGGIAPGVLLADLPRLAGADAVLLPIPSGRFSLDERGFADVRARLARPLGGLAPSWSMLGGGLDRARLGAALARFGGDAIYLLGGGVLAARDLAGEVAACRELVETAAR